MNRLRLWSLCLFLLAGPALAVDYFIDVRCAVNGNGQGEQCATTANGLGAYNALQTTTTAGNRYFYRRGTWVVYSTTAITVNQGGVTIGSYGISSDDPPKLDANNSAGFAITVSSGNNAVIEEVDLLNGSNANATLNIAGTSDGVTVRNVRISTSNAAMLVSGAGVTNFLGTGLDIAGGTSTVPVVYFSSTGAGARLLNSRIRATSLDKTGTGFFALRLSGTATVVDRVETDGGYIGITVQGTDGNVIRRSVIRNAAVAGIRLRDGDGNVVSRNEISGVWNGLEYNGGAGPGLGGGAGAGIDLVDISDACGSNIIQGNYIHHVYQGIVDQCDVGGGNKYVANAMHDYRVNGISYQSDGAEGLIANNSISHVPQDSVQPAGHAIVVQNGSATTTARIINNVAVCPKAGLNVQCVSLPLSAATGPTDINNNVWYAINGANVGALGGVSYQTLEAWRTALQSDVDTTGDDAASRNEDPLWLGGIMPSDLKGFLPSDKSFVCNGGLNPGPEVDITGRPFVYSQGAYQCAKPSPRVGR